MTKKIVFVGLSIVLLALFLEGSCRLYWSIQADVPFFRTKDIIFWFYPELKPVAQATIVKESGYFDILLLGGSVLNKKLSIVEGVLHDDLVLKSGKKIRLHNLTVPAHTSLDSYYKYLYLADRRFDMVVFYHGINDARANNCPASFFKADYSHFLWYDVINSYHRHREINFCVFPFTLRYAWALIGKHIGFKKYLSMESPDQQWLAFGNEVKSAPTFKRNLLQIVDIAHKRKEALLLMTFVYYEPRDYSREKFEHDQLDYQPSTHIAPIELWGLADNVIKAIQAHNQAIKEVASSSTDILFIDQNNLFPKEGKYFYDICHFSEKGARLFAAILSHTIATYMRSGLVKTGLDKEEDTQWNERF